MLGVTDRANTGGKYYAYSHIFASLVDDKDNRYLQFKDTNRLGVTRNMMLNMDASFESAHGANWQIAPSKGLRHQDPYTHAVYVLHQQPRDKVMVLHIRTERAALRTYKKDGCTFEVQALADLDGGNFLMSLLDTKNGEFYILNGVDGTATKMKLTNQASSPLFDWHTRVTNIVTNDAGIAIAYSTTGSGFALRSPGNSNPDRCIAMEMIAEASITLVSDIDVPWYTDEKKYENDWADDDRKVS